MIPTHNRTNKLIPTFVHEFLNSYSITVCLLASIQFTPPSNAPSIIQVLFYCDHPATPGHGGESVVGDVRDILPKLNKEVVNKFERLGVRYYNYVGCKKTNDSHRSWQKVSIDNHR